MINKQPPAKIIPFVALKDLVEALIPQNIEHGVVELSISIESNDINIRELNSFLFFIDRVYGRMKDWGLTRYSKLPYQQLKINQLRFGSLEIVISEILKETKEYLIPIATLFLALKIIKPMSEVIKNSSESYKSLKEAKKLMSETIKFEAESHKLLSEANKMDEEIRLIKANVEQLQNQLQNTEFNLNNLNEDRTKQFFKLMKELYQKEEKQLPKLKKFAEKKIKNVKLEIRK